MEAATRNLDQAPTAWYSPTAQACLPVLTNTQPFYPSGSPWAALPCVPAKFAYADPISRELLRLEEFQTHALEQLRQVKELWLSEVARAIVEIEGLIREKCRALAEEIVRDTGDAEELAPSPGLERLDLNIDLKPLDINSLLKQFVNLTLEYAQPPAINSYLYKFFGSQNSVARFDVRSEDVSDTFHSTERFLHNAAWLVTATGDVYITGGSLMGKSKEDVLVFRPDSNTTAPLKGMQSPRRSHAMVQWTSRIYVFGGVCEEKKLVHSEYYEEGTELWSRGSDLICPRAYHGAAVYRNYIYIAGGADTSGLERLTPSSGAMDFLPLDTVLTESCSLVSLDDSLLLLHGNYQGQVLQINPETAAVLRVSQMCHGNSWSNCSPVRHNDVVYTVRADSVFRLDVVTLQSGYVTRLGRAAKRRQGESDQFVSN